MDSPDFPVGAALVPTAPVLLRLSKTFLFSVANNLEGVGVLEKTLLDLRILVDFVLFIVETRWGLERPLVKDDC